MQPSDLSIQAVHPNLARTMVRRLAGLKGYPQTPEAEGWLVEILSDHALSVDHARYVMDAMNELCPTPRGLIDALEEPAVRARFGQKPEDSRERWLAEGATFDPEWSEKLLGALRGGPMEPLDQIRRRSMRDALWYTIHPEGQAAWKEHLQEVRDLGERQRERAFWDLAKQHHERHHAEELAAVRREMQEPGAWDEYLS